jgi:hypothetical protein
MALCDQHTVTGWPCKQKATWEHDEPARNVARGFRQPVERYCTQHANIYGVPRGEASGRSRRIDAEGNVVESKAGAS